MRVQTGTSGFSFDEWRGHFYPSTLHADARLGYYSARLSSVEINNTFYQMPKPVLFERWRDTVPEGFRFALKAPRRITHAQKLKGTREPLEYFLSVTAALGQTLGPVLFQLPPFVSKDRALLADFLALLPSAGLFAFEFRHGSWFDDEIFTLLADRNAALCGGDADKGERSPPMAATADFGYLRLRAPTYDEPTLGSWAQRIKTQPWTEAYVFLKHEILGPTYALFLAATISGESTPPLKPAATTTATPKTTASSAARSERALNATPRRRRLANE